MVLLGYIFAVVGFAFFAIRRLPRYLHMFQQDDYNGKRLIEWLVKTRTFDTRVSATLLAVAVGSRFVADFWSDEVVYALIFAGFALVEPDPRREAKKKLVMTQRATRIFVAALALNVFLFALLLGTDYTLMPVIAVQIIPLVMVLANRMLSPLEAEIQRKIMDEARARLAKINPQVIGITGSFGKTSVKHILGHILEMNAPTLFTPGSVNTPMGISRIIRENLPVDCRYFIVEMGAYGEGSIRKLCGLTPPQAGIITALGEAHYERFKTLDNVARAKFELAEAVLAQPAGAMVVHENVLAQDYAAQFIKNNPQRFIVCGGGPNAAVRIETVEQTASGINLQLRWKDESYALSAPLFGAHHAGNMALAFATAVTLGIAPERAIAALRSTPQIKHRLEVKPQPGGGITIDDAFNSNPAGFTGALELMSLLAQEKPRRRVLMTPGLVELGDRHDSVHRELGAAAARHADIVLAVHPNRIPSFAEGFRAANANGELHPVANLAEGQKWLAANGKPDDILLIENDLPDVFERKLEI